MEQFRGYFRANAHNIRDAMERGGEQRRKTLEGSSGHHMPMRLSEGTAIQQASVVDISECRIWKHVYARVGKGASGAVITRPLQSVIWGLSKNLARR